MNRRRINISIRVFLAKSRTPSRNYGIGESLMRARLHRAAAQN